MKRLMTRLTMVYLGFAAALNALILPVRASIPQTGDDRIALLGGVMIALGVSMVIVIAIVVMNMRGRKRQGGKGR